MILLAGCSPCAADGQTALQYALKEGKTEIALMLIDAGAVLCGGEAVLAVRHSEFHMVEELVRRGADIHQRGLKGETLLEAAIASRKTASVAAALALGVAPYDPGALCSAVQWSMQMWPEPVMVGDSDLIELLLRHRNTTKPTDVLEGTAVAIAVARGDLDFLKRLAVIPAVTTSSDQVCILPRNYQEVRHEYREGGRGLPAEEEAFWYDDGNKTRRLREHSGTDLYSPFVFNNELDVTPDEAQLIDKFAWLLSQGFRPDTLALHWAVELDLPLALNLLLENHNGHPPRLHCGYSLLQRATSLGHNRIVSQLIDWRHDPNETIIPTSRCQYRAKLRAQVRRSFLIRSALQAAVGNGDLKTVQILLKAGADVNGSPSYNYGATALQLAAIKGFLGIARRLHSLGADINARGAMCHGRTALDGAAEHGRIDMIQFLLSKGAETTGDGRRQYLRAIAFAEREGHHQAALLLRRHRQLRDDERHQVEHDAEALLESDSDSDWGSESTSSDDESSAVGEDTEDRMDIDEDAEVSDTDTRSQGDEPLGDSRSQLVGGRLNPDESETLSEAIAPGLETKPTELDDDALWEEFTNMQDLCVGGDVLGVGVWLEPL